MRNQLRAQRLPSGAGRKARGLPARAVNGRATKKNPHGFVMPEEKIPDCIGTPDQITKRLREFEAEDVDQVVFFSQTGKIRREMLCSSF